MDALVYLWRAVDAEGEVLDVPVQTKRNKRAALKLMRKLLRKYGFVPDKLITEDLMLLQLVILGSQNAMNAVDGATIELSKEDARVQERGIRAEISLSACSNL